MYVCMYNDLFNTKCFSSIELFFDSRKIFLTFNVTNIKQLFHW